MRKQLISSKINPLTRLLSSLLKIYLPVCLFIIFVYFLTENTSISVYELVADPNEVGQVAPYTGLVSTIGILIFCATVSICLFSGYLLDSKGAKAKRWNLFLKASGYFILLLLVDDLWQLHENLSTLLFGAEANITVTNRSLQNTLEMIVFGVYALLFSWYLLKFRKLIYQTEFLIIILAFCFFSGSMIIDLFLENINGHFILEEGLKLLGIVSLLIYYSRVCWQKIKQLLF